MIPEDRDSTNGGSVGSDGTRMSVRGAAGAADGSRSPYFCYRCGHLWISKSDIVPKRCPRCHSSRWDVAIKRDILCKFCGHGYQLTGMDDPCPNCGRKQTEGLTDRSLHCNQCDYVWNRRGDAMPKKCPMCHSSEWAEPKKERYMCQQCGHIWTKQSEHPERCPKCKSRIWDQPQKVVRCQRCGYVWKTRCVDSAKSMSSVCPQCRSTKWNEPMHVSEDASVGKISCRDSRSVGNELMRCPECNAKWYSKGGRASFCPECGNWVEPLDPSEPVSVRLWTDGRFELTYLVENDCGFVYLWDDDIPVAVNYIHELLRGLGMKINEVVECVNAGTISDRLRDWAEKMFQHRNDYEVNISYFMKRLSLDKRDARVLAIHFTGMNPDAIASCFSLDRDVVYAAFDRIMLAYRDSGIIVDDTVFTEDPFSMY